ncbi:Uma2 family endonuclease [Luteolibacter flavescens]|uniref:Uma2 family endonuclease n=1 Tax=Luteolibacter flavescens TaxID=1859460 RepID=A0ABT3FU49_9BACT|nr:Uma2 family endonuclease [Luteolibacter flavescens]MCW1887109.1 Uma2 family endonuclease [Luteolibacter flavescens]
MSLAIQLPLRGDQTEFNLRVWERLLADPELAKITGRFETDRHGHILMSPPPGYHHGSRQFEIGYQLRTRLGGNVRTECPLSTSDGVKAVDVVWLSDLRESTAVVGEVLVESPEICVEVISPSNTRAEMEEKMALYFDAGAIEVWFCDENGGMRFVGKQGPLERSLLCPDFPALIES